MFISRLSAKMLIITVCLSLISGCHETVRKTGPRIAIYLVTKPSALLENVELAPVPLLTEDDIVSFKWLQQQIVLTDEGFSKIPSSSQVGVNGKPFVVVVDGHRCYLGAFWTGISSVASPNPVIDVLRAKDNIITILRAYPQSQFGAGPDPRADQRLQKALTELKKIN
jgi:hypothetical protein